jgi:hypothetical protein
VVCNEGRRACGVEMDWADSGLALTSLYGLLSPIVYKLEHCVYKLDDQCM